MMICLKILIFFTLRRGVFTNIFRGAARRGGRRAPRKVAPRGLATLFYMNDRHQKKLKTCTGPSFSIPNRSMQFLSIFVKKNLKKSQKSIVIILQRLGIFEKILWKSKMPLKLC
jgi:hypothetical protein